MTITLMENTLVGSVEQASEHLSKKKKKRKEKTKKQMAGSQPVTADSPPNKQADTGWSPILPHTRPSIYFRFR